MVVHLGGFLFAWLLDLQDTRDLTTVKEYSQGASKSLLDVSDVLGSRDVRRNRQKLLGCFSDSVTQRRLFTEGDREGRQGQINRALHPATAVATVKLKTTVSVSAQK